MAERDPNAPVADPPETAPEAPEAEPAPGPSTEPSPEPTTTEGGEQPTGGTEGADKTEEPEPSAFDKLTAGLTDPDEIEAFRERLAEKLPEDRRAPKPKVDDAEQQRVAEARRREMVDSAKAKQNDAIARLNAHLTEVRKGLLDPNRDADPDYDSNLLSTAIQDAIQAESVLADNSYREAVANAVVSRLAKAGADLQSVEGLQALAKRADDNGYSVLDAYLDEWGDRRHAEGLAEGQAQAKSRDDKWVRAEAAAQVAERMREAGVEPDAGVSRSGGLTTERLKKMTTAEIMELPQEDLERALANTNGR